MVVSKGSQQAFQRLAGELRVPSAIMTIFLHVSKSLLRIVYTHYQVFASGCLAEYFSFSLVFVLFSPFFFQATIMLCLLQKFKWLKLVDWVAESGATCLQ